MGELRLRRAVSKLAVVLDEAFDTLRGAMGNGQWVTTLRATCTLRQEGLGACYGL